MQGLTHAEIAKALYGGFDEKEIEEKLKRLVLIEAYLNYIHEPLNYKKAEGVHEHFINLQKIMNKLKDDGEFEGSQLFDIQQIAFELIRQDKPQMEIRKIKKILEINEAKTNFLRAVTKLPDLSRANDEAETGINQDEDEDDENSNTSPVVAIFEDCLDIVEAKKQKDKPIVLLTKAIRNLEGIEYDEHLKSPGVSEKLKQIEKIIMEIKSKLNPSD